MALDKERHGRVCVHMFEMSTSEVWAFATGWYNEEDECSRVEMVADHYGLCDWSTPYFREVWFHLSDLGYIN